MLLAANESSIKLAKKIMETGGLSEAKVTKRVFPDGEYYIRVEGGVEYKEIVVLFCMYPEQNQAITELLLLADTLKDLGASKITAVIPYLPYARQDRRFQQGEALSIKTIAKLLKTVGVSRLITVDTHFHREVGDFDFFGVSCTNVSAGKVLLEHARQKIGAGFEVIGPDFGSSEIIKHATGKETVMKKVKVCPECGKEKQQCRCKGNVKYLVKEMVSDMDFKGKNVVVLDDMIASGNTMIAACKKLSEMGARNIVAAATHGLFLSDSLKKLQEIADHVVVTDTIQTPVSEASVAQLIADALKDYKAYK